jgi:hypothetical protein
MDVSEASLQAWMPGLRIRSGSTFNRSKFNVHSPNPEPGTAKQLAGMTKRWLFILCMRA